MEYQTYLIIIIMLKSMIGLPILFIIYFEFAKEIIQNSQKPKLIKQKNDIKKRIEKMNRKRRC